MCHSSIKGQDYSQMIKPQLYHHIQEAASLLAVELQKAREQNQKLKAALKEVFPLSIYNQLRPDVEEALNGDEDAILNHFIELGINEVDLKAQASEINHYIAIKISEALLRDGDLITNYKSTEQQEKGNRQLKKTEGCNKKLVHNEEHNFALSHTIIHFKSNTICTWIPKNGCSNIRYSVAHANGAISGLRDLGWIHDNNDCFNATTNEVLQADYTFVILRNPFKRLLSFFLDKLCHPNTYKTDKSNLHSQKLFKFDVNMSYSDFINFIWENPMSIYDDEHTRPQSDFIIYRQYDDYFAFEKFKETEQSLREKIGLDLVDVRDSNSIFTSKNCETSQEITYTKKASEIKNLLDLQKKPTYKNMYNSELIKKVSTLYLQDVLLYCNKIKDGELELENWIQQIF